MADSTTPTQERDWLDKLLDVVKVGGDVYAATQTSKASAQLNQAIQTSNVSQQASASTTSHMAKNVLLVVGGTLGLILVFSTVKSMLK